MLFPAGQGAGTHLLLSAGLCLALFLAAAIDIASLRLPDLITLPLILAGLALSILTEVTEPLSSALGAAAGYGLIAGLRSVWLRWKGIEGIGLGDAKFLAGLGAWTGIEGLPPILLIASAIGLAVTLAFAALSRTQLRLAKIPFGPFLAIGGWATWWLGLQGALL